MLSSVPFEDESLHSVPDADRSVKTSSLLVFPTWNASELGKTSLVKEQGKTGAQEEGAETRIPFMLTTFGTLGNQVARRGRSPRALKLSGLREESFQKSKDEKLTDALSCFGKLLRPMQI